METPFVDGKGGDQILATSKSILSWFVQKDDFWY